MTNVWDVSLADQIAEVKREVAMRRKVYDHQVAVGKMLAADAEARTVRMVAVLQTLERLAEEASRHG